MRVLTTNYQAEYGRTTSGHYGGDQGRQPGIPWQRRTPTSGMKCSTPRRSSQRSKARTRASTGSLSSATASAGRFTSPKFSTRRRRGCSSSSRKSTRGRSRVRLPAPPRCRPRTWPSTLPPAWPVVGDPHSRDEPRADAGQLFRPLRGELQPLRSRIDG